VILINLKKKLLATAAVGAVLIVSAVLVASLKGNDKPAIETNPPADDEPPASNTEPDTDPDLPAEPATDVPDEGDDDGSPTPPDDSEDDDDSSDADDGKKKGLERAYQVHLRNMEKHMEKFAAKGMTASAADLPPGLVHSTVKLGAKLGLTETLDLEDPNGKSKGDNGKHLGQA